MAVKRIEFRNIKGINNSNSFSIGGLRIDTLNGYVKTEYVLKETSRTVETQPFIFSLVSPLIVPLVTRGSLSQTLTSSDNEGFETPQVTGWFSSLTTNTVMSIIFKKPLEYVKGISFVPIPNSIDVGGLESFDIFYYDGNNELILSHTYKLNPNAVRNEIVYIDVDLFSGMDGEITIENHNTSILRDRNSTHRVNFTIRPPLRGNATRSTVQMQNLGYTALGTLYKAFIPFNNYGLMFSLDLRQNTIKNVIDTEIEEVCYFLIKYKGNFYNYRGNSWNIVNVSNEYDLYNFVYYSMPTLSTITEKKWGELIKDDFEVFMIITDLQGGTYNSDGTLLQTVPTFDEFKEVGRVFSSSYVSNRTVKYLDGYVFLSGFDKVWRTSNGKNTNQFIGYTFTSRRIVNAFSITIKDNIETSPKDILFMAKNDEDDWIILHVENNIQWSTTRQTKVFEIINSRAYRSYRLFIKSVYGGGYVELAEFRMSRPSMLSIMTERMTSNTTPSSEGTVSQYRLTSANSGFRVFDRNGSTLSNFNLSASSIANYGYPFVQYNFNRKKNIFCYSVTNTNSATNNVNDFYIYGINNGSTFYIDNRSPANYDDDRVDTRFYYPEPINTVQSFDAIKFEARNANRDSGRVHEITYFTIDGASSREQFIEIIHKDKSNYTYKVEITSPNKVLLKEVNVPTNQIVNDYVDIDKESFFDTTPHTITVTVSPLILNSNNGEFNYVKSTTRFIYNTAPKINATFKALDLTLNVVDEENDNFDVKLKLNGNNYEDFIIDGGGTLHKTFKSTEVNINNKDFTTHNNRIDIEVTDRYKLKSNATINFAGVYRNLMFTDVNGSYYTTDLGELLQYLDMGVVIKSTKTLPIEVYLINQLPYIVYDIELHTEGNLPLNTFISLCEVESPFIAKDSINLIERLQYLDRVPFYVRFDSYRNSFEGLGSFKIYAKGSQKPSH